MNTITTFESVTPERITKQAISDFAEALIQEVEDGNLLAMDVQLRLKFMQDLAERIKERLRPLLLDELSKYTKGEEIVKHNARFEVKEMGVRYDYANCDDPMWNELKEKVDLLNAELKEREAYLKALPSNGVTVVNEETGEIIKIHPPIKTSTTTATITWKA